MSYLNEERISDEHRLVKLLNNYFSTMCVNDPVTSRGLATYLLENGLMFPQCTPGDTVWYITGITHYITRPVTVVNISIGEEGITDMTVKSDWYATPFILPFNEVYMSQSEAEKALRERETK